MSKSKKNNNFIEEKIINDKLEKLIGEKFGNYSKYIIQERALPDLRDGLKPVQRRVLYAMHDLKLNYNSAYKKSARVVGDVIGKYHPHGDTSVYDAMVRLGQEWKLNMPLVDMHGNKGSVDGDSPAAMRYTEARLAKISSQLLKNIEKDLVLFSPNFDDSELEPTILPAKFPNLLVNGSSGIASGYATNIPPHNLKEVIKALIFILKNDSFSLSNILRFIKGPDFPTGGSISTSSSIKEAYRNGKGKISISSKWKYNNKTKIIEITEIPFEVNKSDLIRKIDDLIRNNKIPNVKEIRDDTDRSGLQISLILKPEANVELIMNYLFKATDLRKNYNFNMVSIKDKKPHLLGLLDMLTSFIDFQIEIYTKLYKFELLKLNKRLEVVNGLIKMVDLIDEVINLIRKSKNKKEAKENLKTKFDFSENQAEAIVTLRLYRLTSTDVNELKHEKKLLNESIKHYKKGIEDEVYLKENIISELEEISNEYGVPRKTLIENEVEELIIDEKDLIEEEEVWVSVTYQGYIKKISQKSKDASEESSFGKREDDILISLALTSNIKNLVLFSAKGRYYSIPIYKLIDSKYKDLGEHVSKFTSLDALDRIVATAIVDNFEKGGELIFSTEKGMIKRSLIKEMNSKQNKKGSKYMNVKEDDNVVSVSLLTNENSFLTTITESGHSLKYIASNLSSIGLSAAGVKNVDLGPEDKVVSTIVNNVDEVESGASELFLITNNGRGKKVKVRDIKSVSRGSKGSLVSPRIKSNPHKIINFFNMQLTDEIYILNDANENIILKPNENFNLKVSEISSNLSKIIDSNIKFSFNDLILKIDSLDEYSEKKENDKKIQSIQFDLESLLDEF